MNPCNENPEPQDELADLKARYNKAMNAPTCPLCGWRKLVPWGAEKGIDSWEDCPACHGTGHQERREGEQRVTVAVDMSWDGNGYLSPETGGWRECRRQAKRRKDDTVNTYLDLDDACNGNHEAQEELAVLKARCNRAMDDRDHYRSIAEQKFAMRREFEELLGLEPDATYNEKHFRRGLERMRQLNAIADAAKAILAYGEHGGVDMDNLGNGWARWDPLYDALKQAVENLEKGE